MERFCKRWEFLEENIEYQPVKEDLLPGSLAIENQLYINGLKLGFFWTICYFILENGFNCKHISELYEMEISAYNNYKLITCIN